MDLKKLAGMVDHTLLKQTATWEQVKKLCDEAVRYHAASVCIPPALVKEAAAYGNDALTVCTVIGFPNGYQTTAVKVFETEDAIRNGAREIDMVINLGMVKSGQFDLIEEEIRSVKQVCGDRILKVIIETCLLTMEEKIRMCEVIARAGADYVKTSTGFSTGGATLSDVELLRMFKGAGIKIKAAGGIRTIEQAQALYLFGADRIGASRLLLQIAEKEAEKQD